MGDGGDPLPPEKKVRGRQWAQRMVDRTDLLYVMGQQAQYSTILFTFSRVKMFSGNIAASPPSSSVDIDISYKNVASPSHLIRKYLDKVRNIRSILTCTLLPGRY